MPKIIYIQQHVGDNGRKFSPSRNSHYVKYIGEREHVLKNHETNLVKYMGEREHAAKRVDKLVKEEAEHLVTYDSDAVKDVTKYDVKIDAVSEGMLTEPENGLFGYIDGKFSDEYRTADMQKYVRRISTPHRNVFHSVFSFTPDSAEDAGLKTLDDWESWTRYHINDIANGMNMKVENIEYLAAVHLKEGQPHVHIMWWDKSQQVLINRVDPLVCDKIRMDVTLSTYREMFSEIYNQEDIMRRELRKSIGEYTLSNVVCGASDDYTMHIMAGIQKVAMLFPPKGQFKYAYINKKESPARIELDKLTHYIIDNNPVFKEKYDEICAQRLLYNQLLHSESSNYGNFQIDRYMKQVNDKIEAAVGNEILRIIKSEKLAGRLNAAEVPQTCEIPDEPSVEDVPMLDSEALNKSRGTRCRIQWSDKFKSARELVKSKMYDEALKLYSEEADKGNVLAMYEIGDLYRKKLVEGDSPDRFYKTALEGFLQLELSAQKLATYIRYRIGRMFYDGYGTQVDYNAAFNWLKKAADDNHHYAAYTVGKMLYRGLGTQQDTVTAVEYLKNAAAEIPAAGVMLGKICLSSHNANSESEAIEWFSKAAEKSVGDAAYSLYKIFRGKENMQKEADENLALAIKLYEDTVKEKPNTHAEFMLGKIYGDTETSRFDFEKAERYLHNAANSNDSYTIREAEYLLGKLYFSQGESRHVESLMWLERAFLHGNNNAALSAAKILSDEKSELFDIKAAKLWLRKAIRQEYAQKSDMLAKKQISVEADDLMSWGESGGFGEPHELLADGVDVSEEAASIFSRSILRELYYKLGKISLDTAGDNIEADREALAWIKNSADEGNPYAAYIVGKWMSREAVVSKDYRKAVDYLTIAAEKVPAACISLGKIYLSDEQCRDAVSRAALCFERAAKMSDGDGAFCLYKLYRSQPELQNEAERQLERAISLYESKDDIFSALKLGKLYSDVDTSKFDFEKAKGLLLQVAHSDDNNAAEMAEYPLAKLFIGQGEKCYDDALMWLEKAFDHGNIYSALAAAKILSDSQTHFYNVKAAKEWLAKAIELTEKSPCSDELVAELNYRLGRLHLSDEDYLPQQAEECLKRSVSFGNAYAMCTLARLYINDDSLKDLKSAIVLLNNAKASAPTLSPFVDYTLGTMYLFEKEVRDATLAKKYLAASANAGNEYAQMILDSQSADCVLNLMSSVGMLLAENMESDRAALSECSSAAFGHGDMSVEQIREYLLKLQDKENTAQM